MTEREDPPGSHWRSRPMWPRLISLAAWLLLLIALGVGGYFLVTWMAQ